MMQPLWSEDKRLKALRSYEILDTARESEFDDIVTLASQICETPISTVTLIDAGRQWFKAEVGLNVNEMPLDDSICARAILQDDFFVVSDTTKDPRFQCNPLVIGDPKLRFYAGALLETSDGLPLGTLCVLDYKPRELTELQIFALKALSRQVMSQMELRRALKEKQSVESKVNLAFDSPEFTGFWSWNLETNLLTSEPRFAQMYGVDPEMAALGAPLAEYTKNINPDDMLRITPSIERTIKEGENYEEEYRLKQSDGKIRWVSARGTARMNEHGKPVRFDGVAIDITDRKKLEEIANEALQNAETANIAKTEFLANMSHEIRTPMNAIIGLSNILSNIDLPEKQKQYVKTLQMSADSLLALINDLLDISKIEARSVELEHIPFSMTKIMQEVISMMGVRVKEKNLTFTGEGESVERRMYMGDPTRVRQIVLNLCSNAIKFTDKGNIHLAVTCEETQDSGIEDLCISITETGIGIAPKKLETIFQKFIQADSSINRKYGGTGLGLAITKTLVEIMGGTLSVESTLHVGSTFTVRIPLQIAENVPLKEIEPFPEFFAHKLGDQENRKILLVEDYEPNVLVASIFLEGFGYDVDVAINGHEAFEKIKNTNYAAVLMDVQMYGMNGFESTELVRQYEKINSKSRVPIIGMTAHALKGDRERCISVGMDDYISKPFNPAELQTKIGNLIRASYAL